MQCKLNQYSIFISKKKKRILLRSSVPNDIPYSFRIVFLLFFSRKNSSRRFLKTIQPISLIFSQMTVNGLHFNVLIFKDVTTGQDLSTVF